MAGSVGAAAYSHPLRPTLLPVLLFISVVPSSIVVSSLPSNHQQQRPATPEYGDEVHSVGYDHSEWLWGVPTGGRQGPTTCVPIPSNLSLCRGIRYDQMRLPNLLDHDSIREVTQQANDWIHLLSIRCHPDTQVFLCSLFAPVCFDRPIWPCRSLCLAVQGGCERRMTRYGFSWPEMLRCDRFPPDNDLCINVLSEASEDETCSVCNQPETFASIFDNFCHASFAMQIKVDKTTVSEDSLLLNAAKKKTVYKAVGFSKKESGERMVFHVDNFTRCNCTQTGLQRQAKKLGQFLVMGHKSRDRYVLKFVMKIDRKSCEMKEALQAMKNANICKNSSKAINISDVDDEKRGNGKVAAALMTSKCGGKGSGKSTAKIRKVTQAANLDPRRSTATPPRPLTPKKSQKNPGGKKTTQRAKGDKQRKPKSSKGPPSASTNLKPKSSKGPPSESTNLKPKSSKGPPSASTNLKPKGSKGPPSTSTDSKPAKGSKQG